MKLGINFLLFWLLLGAEAASSPPYNGCNHQIAGYDPMFPARKCGNPGYLTNPAPLGPQFVTKRRNQTSAFEVCAYACFDNFACKSLAWQAKTNTCRLLKETIVDQGWKDQQKSDVSFWSETCLFGWDEEFPAEAYVKERFKQDSTSLKISPSNYWWYSKDRCKSSAQFSRSVNIWPPRPDIVTLQRDMTLPIGRSYVLRFDFMYQSPDPMSIIFGYVSYNDKWPGPDQFFELARADDATLDGVWQTAKTRFDTDTTNKYRLTLEFGHQPGATVANRTKWYIDNLVVYPG